jgi:hypothetical protein
MWIHLIIEFFLSVFVYVLESWKAQMLVLDLAEHVGIDDSGFFSWLNLSTTHNT